MPSIDLLLGTIFWVVVISGVLFSKTTCYGEPVKTPILQRLFMTVVVILGIILFCWIMEVVFDIIMAPYYAISNFL